MEDEHRVAQLQAQEEVIEDDLALLREREERIRQLEVCFVIIFDNFEV